MSILYNVGAIIACLSMGACIGAVLMACFAAGAREDQWAEQFHAQLNREEVEKRTLYREQRERAAR